MSESTSDTRYTTVAIALHWLIAIFILFNLAIGWFMDGMAMPLKMLVLPIHVSGGMTVLVLTVLRVVWRLTHRPPAFFADMSGLERTGAHIVHFALYTMMFAMPLIGWMLLSAHPARPGPGLPIWWGLFHLTPIAAIQSIALQPGGIAAQTAWHDTFDHMHTAGATIMIALLVLHVAGALKHQIIDKQAELARMGLGKASAAVKTGR